MWFKVLKGASGSIVSSSQANHWLDDACARAFWDQHKAVPYQELLRDTANFLGPKAGERWLDLGCGGGQLTSLIWQTSAGLVRHIVAFDCAAANALAISRLRGRLRPLAAHRQIEFVQGNFSEGLGIFPDAYFDGVVSGLAISYAESRDPATGTFTDAAYNRCLAEVARVLKPEGRFVFSVNVPQPRFWRILWRSLRTAVQLSKPAKVFVNAVRMQRYGRWLRHEARRGRFHFFPLAEILARLARAGFEVTDTCLSYAGQAYVISARKQLALSGRAESRAA
jgi:ubiquinone/menaquinone biosynthesis C-methylase UbiE